MASRESYTIRCCGHYQKDLEFTRELARRRMTEKKTLLKRLAATRLEAALARAVRGRIERDFMSPGR